MSSCELHFFFFTKVLSLIVLHVDKGNLQISQDIHSHNTSHRFNFHLPVHRTSQFEKKPLYMGKKSKILINLLAENIKILPGEPFLCLKWRTPWDYFSITCVPLLPPGNTCTFQELTDFLLGFRGFRLNLNKLLYYLYLIF